MKYLKKYELFEKKEEKKFTSKNRIILLGHVGNMNRNLLCLNLKTYLYF